MTGHAAEALQRARDLANVLDGGERTDAHRVDAGRFDARQLFAHDLR
jgi:hypothetical protein